MEFLRDIWSNKWVKLLALLLSLALFAYFIHVISKVLTALAISWVLAYICDPLVDRLEKRRVPRTAGVAIIAVAIVLAIALVELFVLPAIVHEISRLGQDLPNYSNIFATQILPKLEATFNISIPRTDAEMRNFFLSNRETFNKIAEAAYSPVTIFLKNAMNSVVGFITILLTLVVIPVAWFFLLRDIDRMNAAFADLIPQRWRAPFVDFMKQVDEIVSNFLRGQITVALILGALYAIGLWLILDIPLGLIIGVIAGFASIVPYMGLVIGILPALIMAFLQYQDWQHPLGVIAVFAVAQGLEGNLITPKIVGDKLGLHPVTVIFALLVWAELLGLLGMLIAVPATAVLQVLLTRAIQRYRAGSFYQGTAE